MYKIPANTLFIGKVVEYMPSCHSTNDRAREMLAKPDTTEGTVVITDHQTAGKGQRGNSWFSAEGMNLTFSVVLKPNFLDVSRQFYLNMISSLAVMKTVKHFVPDLNAQVKWPNDVLIDAQKTCGILIENGIKKNRLEYSIVGIGLNVNQNAFGLDRAISMAKASGQLFSLQQVMDHLLHQLEGLYLSLKAGKYAEIKESYLQNLIGYRQQRKYRAEFLFDAHIVDVLDSGKLKLNTGRGDELFDFKEVEFVWN